MIISTIIPVYNVEKFLKETIQSVLSQDIGFRENVELILVNDESTDSSEKICLEYLRRYPQNIKYIKQENAGVSAARNNGLKHAKGKYVHFLDSDDIVSKNAYSRAIEILEANEEKIDLSAFRVEFFDGRLGEHPLNYKFTQGTRIVNLTEEPTAVILHVSSCLIRRNSIRQGFDSSIKISEDMKFLAELVTQKMAYGVVSEATYYYRKRRKGGSAIDTAKDNISYYTVTPVKVYHYLLDTLKKTKNRPNIYAQYAVAYDLQWRLRQSTQSVLTKVQVKEYINQIHLAIKKINPEVFLHQKELSIAQLEYIFGIKYGENIPSDLINELKHRSRYAQPTIFLFFLEKLDNNTLRIEGRLSSASSFHEVKIVTDRKFTNKLQYVDTSHYETRFLHDRVSGGYVFKVDIPADKIKDSIEFTNFNNVLPIVPRRQSKIPHARFGYRKLNDLLIINKVNQLQVLSYTKIKHTFYGTLWMVRILIAVKAMESAKQLIVMARSSRKRSVRATDVLRVVVAPIYRLVNNSITILYRLLYILVRPSKQIWIISDRPFSGGDNGEAFNAYLDARGNSKINAYFAISKKAKDYRQLRKKYKNVINNNGLRYKLLFLRSSKVISSQADDFVINPFGARVEHLYDLFSFDFIFLQHGILRNDLSSWLNRYNKNIRLFITSAKKEYQSILDYDYGYEEKNVLLSGMPRFDLLQNNPQKKIILAPTWRHNLSVESNNNTGIRPYNPTFKHSAYFTFFNTLINHPVLQDSMKEYGVIGEFYLHPLLNSQVNDFNENDSFKMMHFPYNYKKAFEEGSLLITDYSSVFFDFAYLRKPVIYTQFDKDVYYESQMYDPGYMDDARDGFGPVAEDIETAVEEIVASIKSGFKISDKYLRRINDFYAWHDTKNSQRVYDAILEMDS